MRTVPVRVRGVVTTAFTQTTSRTTLSSRFVEFINVTVWLDADGEPAVTVPSIVASVALELVIVPLVIALVPSKLTFTVLEPVVDLQ
jgi:hypothetical protein